MIDEPEELEKIKINYDVKFHKEEKIKIPNKPSKGLVLLVGSSGSGKSTILREWFEIGEVKFDNNKNVIENFTNLSRAQELLKAFGLRSIPTWFRKYSTLSNGEAHRAYCAKAVDSGFQYIDEFTSVVDRDTAKSLAVSIRKHHKNGLLVLASCHRDIIEWLCPDTIYDTDSCQFDSRGFLQRPSIDVGIRSSNIQDWIYFKKHHYLNNDVSPSCHFYTALVGNKKVAFNAVIHRCGRDIKSYWGESRLVVIPEFQGLGIGKAMSESIAQEYIDRGLRYFSKTSHPVLGESRNRSKKWRKTSTNMQKRGSYLLKDGSARKQKGFGKTEESILRDATRVCYSHEYIGED